LAIGLLAAVQGGLLLSQVRRSAAPLEAALDALIDHIAYLRWTVPPAATPSPA
jgi:TetR/AcrR family transcriptional repressor of nem operon